MKTFIIGDTHFGHTNIIKYCNRPFANVEEMDAKLIEYWNNTVKKDDIVYHFGDFAMGNKEKIKAYREQLNGKIFLIKGNHDGYSYQSYLDMGFEKVYDKPIIYGDFWIFSHEPMFINSACPYGNIFAHVHDNPEYNDISPQSFCASAERINYRPILLDDVFERILAQQNAIV